jgi:hypothetical protein
VPLRTPTDRGIAIIKNETDGTRTVLVCSAIRGSTPVDVFALHYHRPHVEVGPGVRLRPIAGGSVTEGMAIVVGDSTGTVYLRSPETEVGLVRDGRIIGSSLSV